MELSISNNLIKEKNIDTGISDFIKELQKEVNKNNLQQTIAKGIEIDEKSDLSIVNNIAQNNKMTNENRKELFFQERLSLFDIYNRNKRAGDLYYIVDKGTDSDFYVFIVNKDIRDERFKMIKENELPPNARTGEIYRKKKGEFYLSKEEIKEHNKKMKAVAKDILDKQELEGGYKREFTKNDLVLGEGYEGIYFEYPLEKICNTFLLVL